MKPCVIVIVNYFNTADTLRLLKDLEICEEANKVLAVVVNNSPEEAVDVSAFHGSNLEVRVIESDLNRGYLGAFSFALQQLGPDIQKSFVILSNPDIRIKDPQFFKHLLSEHWSEKTFVIAPQLRSHLTGLDQNPFMSERPSPLRMKFYSLVFNIAGLAHLYQYVSSLKDLSRRRLKYFGTQKTSPAGEPATSIYAPHGAFVIFTTHFFASQAQLSYPIFLFGEEVFIAEEVRHQKGQVCYAPALQVEHIEHASFGNFPTTKTIRHMGEAARYCSETYF